MARGRVFWWVPYLFMATLGCTAAERAFSSGGPPDTLPPDDTPGTPPPDDTPDTPPPDDTPDTPPRDGLLLWLRADDGVEKEDAPLALWSDASGNHLDAAQGTETEQPHHATSQLGDKPAIVFDGIDDGLILPRGFDDFQEGISLFAVVEFHADDHCTEIIQLSNGPELNDVTLGRNEGGLLYEVGDEWFTGGPILVGRPTLLAVVHRPDGVAELRRDGVVTLVESLALPDPVARQDNTLGNGNYNTCEPLDGKIAEVLIYRRGLDPSEVDEVEGYLQDKWQCCGIKDE